jgi:phage gp45-like
MSLLQTIRGEIAKQARKGAGSIRRAMISVAAGADYFLSATGLAGETWTELELWQAYGLASRPPVGGEALVVRPDSEGGEGAVAIATNDRNHRPSDLAAGEVVIYGKSATGQPLIRLKPGGDIELIPATASFLELGSASPADFALKGTTFHTAMAAYLTAMATAKTTWDGSSKLLPDVVIWINAVNTATATLQGTIATWLCTVAKVT